MKKTKIIFIFILISNLAYSQIIFDVNAGYSYTSNNINLNINYDIGVSSIYFGLKFVPNSVSKFNDNSIFKRTLIPNSIKESFGFNLGYLRYFKSSGTLKYFAFLDNQYIKSSYQPTFIFPYVNNDSNEELYVKIKEKFKPTPTLESYLGLGILIPITNKISISQRIGAGVHIVGDIDDRILINNKKTQIALAPIMYNFGLRILLK